MLEIACKAALLGLFAVDLMGTAIMDGKPKPESLRNFNFKKSAVTAGIFFLLLYGGGFFA